MADPSPRGGNRPGEVPEWEIPASECSTANRPLSRFKETPQGVRRREGLWVAEKSDSARTRTGLKARRNATSKRWVAAPISQGRGREALFAPQATAQARTGREALFAYGTLGSGSEPTHVKAPFAYGTLRFGERPPCEPARLLGYGCDRLRGLPFPGLWPKRGACTSGVLYRPISRKALARLDAFEGDLSVRRRVEVTTERGESVRAWVYPFGRRNGTWQNGGIGPGLGRPPRSTLPRSAPFPALGWGTVWKMAP